MRATLLKRASRAFSQTHFIRQSRSRPRLHFLVSLALGPLARRSAGACPSRGAGPLLCPPVDRGRSPGCKERGRRSGGGLGYGGRLRLFRGGGGGRAGPAV